MFWRIDICIHSRHDPGYHRLRRPPSYLPFTQRPPSILSKPYVLHCATAFEMHAPTNSGGIMSRTCNDYALANNRFALRVICILSLSIAPIDRGQVHASDHYSLLKLPGMIFASRWSPDSNDHGVGSGRLWTCVQALCARSPQFHLWFCSLARRQTSTPLRTRISGRSR